MALRNITVPIAALLFATALACTPVMAAPAGSHASSGGRASHSGGGGMTAHSSGVRSGGFRSGAHVSGGPRHAGHRSGGRSHRLHRGGGFVFGFGLGAPYPYYYADDSYIVCRYRRVRYHGRWVRRRYCWRQFW